MSFLETTLIEFVTKVMDFLCQTWKSLFLEQKPVQSKCYSNPEQIVLKYGSNFPSDPEWRFIKVYKQIHKPYFWQAISFFCFSKSLYHYLNCSIWYSSNKVHCNNLHLFKVNNKFTSLLTWRLNHPIGYFLSPQKNVKSLHLTLSYGLITFLLINIRLFIKPLQIGPDEEFINKLVVIQI